MRGTAWDRFWAKVEMGDCWVWTASTTNGGYGQFFPSERERWRAHRWIWTQLVGPIPDGLESDHLCRNPPCVNPDHIRMVTKRVNLDARITVGKVRCKRGHAFDESNTWTAKNGHRRCKKCDAARYRATIHERKTSNGH